ncbi:MAG: hypothetical protein AUH29_07870 [Candidatus Rokubacteria bacterium 13_1_40CM_69_27]|nr:MAG: hypothetical protein AUH29_07870 [Candidatus Rokubacteria bacterium 13_1_40CM_69_27]OLC34136.1 MAG: hypothetical protein AUH81_12880 [Candidatus Rokubacteria bacterium 13_1_40CM_4_69_5]
MMMKRKTGTGKYQRYIVQDPKIITSYKYHPFEQEPFQIYMSGEQVPEATAFADVFWRTKLPTPNPTCEIHAHPAPQILMFVGEAGTFEVEVPLNDEVYVFDRTTVIWIPAGVRHNVHYLRIDAPMMESGILLQPTYE